MRVSNNQRGWRPARWRLLRPRRDVSVCTRTDREEQYRTPDFDRRAHEISGIWACCLRSLPWWRCRCSSGHCLRYSSRELSPTKRSPSNIDSASSDFYAFRHKLQLWSSSRPTDSLLFVRTAGDSVLRLGEAHSRADHLGGPEHRCGTVPELRRPARSQKRCGHTI